MEERAESGERAGRSAEALRKLKHDEALALMLKAEGLSYHGIGERFGWTYTNILCSLGPLPRLKLASSGTSRAGPQRRRPVAPNCGSLPPRMQRDSRHATAAFHECRSAVGTSCAPADAWSSSVASVSSGLATRSLSKRYAQQILCGRRDSADVAHA